MRRYNPEFSLAKEKSFLKRIFKNKVKRKLWIKIFWQTTQLVFNFFFIVYVNEIRDVYTSLMKSNVNMFNDLHYDLWICLFFQDANNLIRHICKIIPVYEEQISVKACQIIHSLTAKQQVTIELQIFIVWNFMTWSFPDRAIHLLFKNMFAKCWEKKKLFIYVFSIVHSWHWKNRCWGILRNFW